MKLDLQKKVQPLLGQSIVDKITNLLFLTSGIMQTL